MVMHICSRYFQPIGVCIFLKVHFYEGGLLYLCKFTFFVLLFNKESTADGVAIFDRTFFFLQNYYYFYYKIYFSIQFLNWLPKKNFICC